MAEEPQSSLRDFWRSVAQNRLLDVGAWVIVALVWVVLIRQLPQQVNRIDFSHYYCSSRLVLETPRPYVVALEPMYARFGFEVEEGKEIRHATNPPPLLWLFVPFALLPPRLAWVAWAIGQGACLAVLLALMRRLLPGRFSPRAWRFVCAALLASAPVYWNLYLAQVQLLVAVLMLSAYALHQEEKHSRACLAIAAAGLIKLFPFILLPWFLYRHAGGWGERLKRALWVAGFLTLMVLATGLSTWQSFFQDGLTLVRDWTVNRQGNYSLPSFFMNLGMAGYGFQPLPAVVRLWWMVGMGCSVAVILLAYRSCLLDGTDSETQFGILTAGMLLGNMVSWGNYFIVLTFSVVALAGRLRRAGSRGLMVVFAVAVVLMNLQEAITPPWLQAHLVLTVLLNYFPFYGLVLFLIVLHKSVDRRITG